jgi:hypothetical protein
MRTVLWKVLTFACVLVIIIINIIIITLVTVVIIVFVFSCHDFRRLKVNNS